MQVLIVDDELNVQQTFYEIIKTAGYHPLIAKDGIEALEILMREKKIAVIVSDMKMPKMTGLELLINVKTMNPQIVRIMLTAYAELEMAINAVNEGSIFRFLTKPISKNNLIKAINAGVEQYRLIMAEKELIEKTLQGSIKTLTDILSLNDPRVFEHGSDVRELSRRLATSLGMKKTWQIELAALLYQIGVTTLPTDLKVKIQNDEELSAQEKQMLRNVPQISARLLSHIPRLESVAEIIRFAGKSYDGSGPPNVPLASEQIPLGSRILHILNDLIALEKKGNPFEAALGIMEKREGRYDEKLLYTIRQYRLSLASCSRVYRSQGQPVSFSELQVGDLLLSEVATVSGQLLLGPGSVITQSLLEKLRNYADLGGLREPIKIKRPEQTTEE